MPFESLTAVLDLDSSGFESGIRTPRGAWVAQDRAASTGKSMQRAGGAMTAGVIGGSPLAVAAGAMSVRLAGIFDWAMQRSIAVMGDDDGFAANNLEGKLANLATEIGEQTLNDTTTFKKLTGRDTLDARVKFEKPIKFENFASLMFATNEMPVFGQDNHAIWRRWVYVDFPTRSTPRTRPRKIRSQNSSSWLI